MAGSGFAISEHDGALTVSRGGVVEFSCRWTGSRLSRAMEWMTAMNASATYAGLPLHAAFRHGGFALWQCWLHELYFPYFTAYAQFQPLFDWLEASGWPRLEIASPLPGELRKALVGSGVAGRDKPPGTLMTLAEMGLRSGLPAAFLRSARRRKSRLLLYTPDIVSDKVQGCDFRFSKVYDWLGTQGVPFSETFHRTDLRLGLRNAKARGRIPMYLELWDPHPRAAKSGGPSTFRMDGLPVSLHSLMERLLPRFAAYCRASALRIEGLKSMLRDSGFRLMLGMDDFRSNNELLIACRETGIRTVLVQHGLITRFNPGWMACGLPEQSLIAPDRYVVRAPFWKSVLERYAPRLARVATVTGGLDGAGGAEPAGSAAHGPRPPKDRVDVLFVAETLWDPREAAPFIERMLADPRLTLHFKIRPDIDAQKQIQPYFGTRMPHRVVLDLAGEKEKIDVVVGSHSSLIYKLLEWEKPIFRLRTSFEYGEQLTIFGLTDDLGPDEDAYARFRQALGLEPRIYAERLAGYRGVGSIPDYREILEEEMSRL